MDLGKRRPTGFATVKYMPMKEHENIVVFGNGKILYNEPKGRKNWK
jgi:hypothetical protein